MAKDGFGLYWEAVLQRILALIRCLLLNTSDNDPNDFPSSKFHFWIILKWSKMLWRQFRCLLLNTSENDPNDFSSSKNASQNWPIREENGSLRSKTGSKTTSSYLDQ